MTTMNDLAREYYSLLPWFLENSDKPDSEPLRHALFTYGDLRKVIEAKERMDRIRAEKT